MVTVTADPTMRAALGKLDQSAEIRDSDGNLIGYFTPVGRPEASLYSRAAACFNPEEMKRRKQSRQQGCTTQELLNRLETLDAG